MDVRAKQRYVVEDEIGTGAPAEAVLATLLDASSWPSWQSEIRSVSGPARVREGDEVHGDARLIGFEVEGASRVVRVTERSFVEDVIVGVRMQVSYELSEEGGGTLVRRRLEANLPGGAAGRLLALVLKRRLKRMQRDLLRKLAAHASVGS